MQTFFNAMHYFRMAYLTWKESHGTTPLASQLRWQLTMANYWQSIPPRWKVFSKSKQEQTPSLIFCSINFAFKSIIKRRLVTQGSVNRQTVLQVLNLDAFVSLENGKENPTIKLWVTLAGVTRLRRRFLVYYTKIRCVAFRVNNFWSFSESHLLKIIFLVLLLFLFIKRLWLV